MKFLNKKNRGFTLLLSLIVMGVVLTIGLGVYNIILKEMQISSLGRESLAAFYAADSGTECILYWDVKRGFVSTTTPSTIQCAGQTKNLQGAAINSFTLNFSNGSCARVTINKSDPSKTEVISYGYNVDCDSSFSRKVERGTKTIY
jgi:Tfp pilus assembly protein PilX